MSKKHDKLITDLQRLMKTQDFKTEEDLRKFMKDITGQKIPSFPTEALNDQEKAQDLVYEAYELPPVKAKKNIEKALLLDHYCIEAYEYLASLEELPEIAIVFYERGIAIGRKLFGGDYLEEHKGAFWGFPETRAFMRCMQQCSDCLYEMGEVEQCVAILEEMIELNKNDNQGVRDQLLLYLLELREMDKFDKYAEMFKEDSMAFALFTRALHAFITEGKSENANEKLQKALSQNPYVAAKILSDTPIDGLAGYHGMGDENEANYYVFYAQDIWKNTKGAISWLKKIASIK